MYSTVLKERKDDAPGAEGSGNLKFKILGGFNI